MQALVVNLEEPQSLPEVYLGQLAEWDAHFRRELYLTNVMKDRAFRRLVEDIDSFCAKNMVLGFHYTRGFPADFLAHGLLVRSGEQSRSESMQRFREIFTPAQCAAISAAWAQHFTAGQPEVRDSRVWFNFTTSALGNGGADRLLTYYGGEQIYLPIRELPGIGKTLRSIGQPLIVKCALVPAELQTFIEHPWGSIVTSSYHRLVNPAAHPTEHSDQDGWQSVSVPPERIEVISYEH